MWRYCVTIPLELPFLSPTRPFRASHSQKWHTHSTLLPCPACNNKPEAFCGDRTAAWLSSLRFPSPVTLYRRGRCCLQLQSGPTGRRYAWGLACCQTSWSRGGTEFRYQSCLCCPSRCWCTFDRRCDHRGWLQGFGTAPDRWHTWDGNSEYPSLGRELRPLWEKEKVEADHDVTELKHTNISTTQWWLTSLMVHISVLRD